MDCFGGGWVLVEEVDWVEVRVEEELVGSSFSSGGGISSSIDTDDMNILDSIGLSLSSDVVRGGVNRATGPKVMNDVELKASTHIFNSAIPYPLRKLNSTNIWHMLIPPSSLLFLAVLNTLVELLLLLFVELLLLKTEPYCVVLHNIVILLANCVNDDFVYNEGIYLEM